MSKDVGSDILGAQSASEWLIILHVRCEGLMKKEFLGIATGGEHRLRKAVEAQVRREHEDELSAATKYWQKVAIEEKIEHEIKERMKQIASPHSLWSS